MTLEGNVPQEIQDQCRDALNKPVKISGSFQVKQELKQDKWETRVLALSQYRLYILSTKTPCRLEQSVNFLEIQTLSSKRSNQVSFELREGRRLCFSTSESNSSNLDTIISHIVSSVKAVFPEANVESDIMTLDLSPPERLTKLRDAYMAMRQKDAGPCGGFTCMYQAMCDYHGSPYRDEIAWDVDTIYMSQDCRELNLGDFDHMDARDLVPVIGALEHNTWFRKFNASNVKLIPDAQTELLRVIERNKSLEELVLNNSGIKRQYGTKGDQKKKNSDFMSRLANAISSNKDCSLTGLDLSNNTLEDRGEKRIVGIQQLCTPIAELPKGLVSLKLSRISLTPKGVNRLAEALFSNSFMPATLKELNLSDNSFRGEDITNLYNFLAQPNMITSLNLSGTDCALDMVFGALLRGCAQCLTDLDLSKNVFTHKKGKEVTVPPSVRQFFSSCTSLQKVSLAGNKLAPEVIKVVLLGIASNISIKDIDLDLSSNGLGPSGSQVIESCVLGVNQIRSLDISDNGFDNSLPVLLNHLYRNKSIKKLAIGKNFFGIKPKYLGQVLDSVVQLIQEEDSALESLSLADSKLKHDTAIVINALGNNNSLTEIDLSGNHMMDLGARMLAKALQINTKLHTVYWDRNHVSPQGFQDIAAALEKNFTLKELPTPVWDAGGALRTNQERTEAALRKIEKLLQRNHSPRKYASDQGYRLQQGILINSTQQMVDELVVKVQDTISELERNDLSSEARTDVDQVQKYIKDADNSKQLLPSLQDVALKSEDSGNLVEQKLTSMAEELTKTMETHLQDTLKNMVECTVKKCPAVMESQSFRAELQTECEDKINFEKDFTRSLLLDQVGADVMNKIGSLNLAVSALMSDRLIDGILDVLSSSQKQLLVHSGTSVSRRSSEKEKSPSPDLSETTTEEDGPTPKERRKSKLHRQVRPKSVVDSTEESVENKELPNAQQAAQPLAPPRERHKKDKKQKDKDTLPDLDLGGAAGGPKLEHLAKSRPRRAKTRATTRPMVRNQSEEDQLEPSEGMDSFFTSAPVTSAPSSKNASPAALRPSIKVKEEKTSEQEKPKSKTGLKKLTGFLNRKQASTKVDKEESPKLKSRSPKPVTKPEEPEEEKKTPETVEEEPAEEEPVVRRPAVPKFGLPGMGGPNFLQEMKAKRTTMRTVNKPEESEKVEGNKPLFGKNLLRSTEDLTKKEEKPVSPVFGKGSLRPVEDGGSKNSLQSEEETKKSPVPAKRILRPKKQEPSESAIKSDSATKPDPSLRVTPPKAVPVKDEGGSPKPSRPTPPLLKPKPAVLAPKPGKTSPSLKPVPAMRSSVSSGRISDEEEKSRDSISSTTSGETSGGEGGKRRSVRDKIAVLDKNSNEQRELPVLRQKASSLKPRETDRESIPERAKSQTESSDATDGKNLLENTAKKQLEAFSSSKPSDSKPADGKDKTESQNGKVKRLSDEENKEFFI